MAHRADDAFTAGLLHDVGKLILAANFPWEYRSIVEKAAREQMPAWEVESTVIGSTHADIGAYLMGIWGLPESIVEAIAFHHAPEGAPLKDLTPLSWVCFANRFAHGSVQGPGEGQTEAWLKICDGIEEDRGEDDDGGGIPLARRYTTS